MIVFKIEAYTANNSYKTWNRHVNFEYKLICFQIIPENI